MPRKSIDTSAPVLRDNSQNGQTQSRGEIRYREWEPGPFSLTLWPLKQS